MKTELTTVPTFTYEQGDKFDEGSEYPIQVKYFHGSIELCQNGDAIVISDDHAKQLFREIIRHLPEAVQKLNQ